MKNAIVAVLFSALLPLAALASTPVEQVDKIDTAREGNLRELAVNYFKANLKVNCDEGQLAKFEALKVATDSSHETKQPGTPYNYSANYVVVQKCLYGSTFVGAYSDTQKAVLLKGSFRSFYNRLNGPAKMENLKFEVLKDLDLAPPAN